MRQNKLKIPISESSKLNLKLKESNKFGFCEDGKLQMKFFYENSITYSHQQFMLGIKCVYPT